MASQTPAQTETVARVMHAFQHGELRQAGGKGPPVRNPKQAIAIALHEAGATNGESPAADRPSLGPLAGPRCARRRPSAQAA